MKLSADGTRLDVRIAGSLTAAQVESLIVDLAMARAEMTPEVPSNRQDALADPAHEILIEENPAMTAALRSNGDFRLWVRNRGIGWMAFEVDATRARGLAHYILSKLGPGPDLFSQEDGSRH